MPDMWDGRENSGIIIKKGLNCGSCALSVFIGNDTELGCLVHRCSVGPGRRSCKSFVEYKNAKQAKEERKKWQKEN